MATTIQVEETTRQMLEMTKKKIGAKTFDETIRKVLSTELNTNKSMFGTLKMKPFTKKERTEMWNAHF
ncbi:MAG: hypothetical protein EPN86_03730 [Nanoarchaeota archaeon]|nr:MAG: hypothetical protein EPN86_03730 [Nanoarchaeota archaeon]